MTRFPTRKGLLFASVAAALLAAPIAFADPGDPAGAAPAPGAAPAARHEGRFLRRMQARRTMRFLRILDLSDAQKTQLSDARTAAEPIRADAHAKVRALFEEAKKGDRTPETRAKFREQVKAIRDAAATQVEPSAKRMIDSLSADQRARLADLAAKHGKTVDDARLLHRFEHVILAPGRRRDAK